jgi:hypothetical protein
VESAKRSGRFGRSCRECKAYFVTSDPNAYLCPWCQKVEKKVAFVANDYGSGRDMADTQMLVQEEV